MRATQSFALVAVLALASVTAAQETVLYYPAAASTDGLNDTFWSTQARIFNPDPDQELTVFASWLPSGSDNSAAPEVSVTIPPRGAALLADLVGQSLLASGAGGVRMRAARPFLAVSRTFNSGNPAVGTFGQTIVGVPEQDALQQGILLGATNDPAPTGFRSNAGFLNTGLGTVTVAVEVYDASSRTLIGEGQVVLPPRGFAQSNVFVLVGEAATTVANATVEFTADRPVIGYLSVVENLSGDAVFILAEADAGTPAAENRPPEGTITTPAGDVTVTVGVPVSFEAAVSDPDGDEVTGTEWDFGDDITASGLSVSHTYSAAGTFTVTFTATDSNGASDPTPATRTVTVEAVQAGTLSEVQAQIFTPSCAFSGCHGGSSPQRGMNLSAGQAYSNIVNVPSVQNPSLDRVEPGQPDGSLLWLKVNGQAGSRMPLGGPPLDAARLELLRSWIEAGALNN